MDFIATFSRNNLTPLPDAALTAQLEQTLAFMKPKDLETFLKSTARFNKVPVTTVKSYPGEFLIDPTSGGEPDYWFHLREDLAKLPAFFDAAHRCEMTYTQTVRLLKNLVAAEKYDFNHLAPNVNRVTDILDSCAAAQDSPTTILQQFSQLFALIRRDGEMGRILSVTKLFNHIGLNLEQGVDLVTTVCQHGGPYTLMNMYDEIDALASHSADPLLLHRTLKAVAENGLHFKNLTETLHLAATQTLYMQNDILRALVLHDLPAPETTSLAPAANKAFAAVTLTAAPNHAELKSPNDYFPLLPKTTLVHGVLPYRLHKSFADGVADLKKLMESSFTEGSFVFDPLQETWYSLGGRSHLSNGRIRHEFFAYDLSRLSQTPVYIHTHPQLNETFIAPDRTALAYPHLQKRLSKLFAALPSAADFLCFAELMEACTSPAQLRASIVTSTGMTNVYFPQDSARIRRLADCFAQEKDNFLSTSDAATRFADDAETENYRDFNRSMIAAFNKHLPQGFSLELQDYTAIVKPSGTCCTTPQGKCLSLKKPHI